MVEPIVHNITVKNIFTTQNNQSRPEIILNNFSNIDVNSPITINTTHEDDRHDDCEDAPDSTDEPAVPPNTTTSPPHRCCTVITPRTCKEGNNRWHCYSRKNKQCGDFCTAPTIYLKPPRVYSRPNYMVIPPLQMDCSLQGNCNSNNFDCSGCGLGIAERCSSYCYRYICPSHRCNFYDQQRYCNSYPGSYGCMQEDGCYDEEWCSSSMSYE